MRVNAALHHEFEQIWLDLAEDRDVNAILLTGAGKAFSVGGDLTSRDKPTKSKGRGGRRIVMADGRRVIENLLDVEQPIVGGDQWRRARVRGQRRACSAM